MFIYQDHVYFPSLPHIYFTTTMIVSPFSTCLFNFSMFYPLPHVYLPRPCFLPITTCLFTKTMFFYPLPHVYLTLACLTHYHMFIYHDHVFLPITTCLFTTTMFFYPLLHVYLPILCLFYSFFQLTIMLYPSSISCFILYPIFVFDARLYYTSNCPTIQINL